MTAPHDSGTCPFCGPPELLDACPSCGKPVLELVPLIEHAPGCAADIRAQAEADPWSFKEGTLLERLEWCRWQHKIGADLSAQGQPSPEPRTPPQNARWHYDCVTWYDGMIRDLKANENLR